MTQKSARGSTSSSSSSCWCTKHIAHRLKHYLSQLTELKNAKTPGKRVAILKEANPCFVRLLCECGMNVLKGKLKLPEHQYPKLRRHKQLLLFTSRKRNSLGKRKQALIDKKGGFLPLILPALISAIAGLAGEAIGKAL
jgi:hypothetical protein